MSPCQNQINPVQHTNQATFPCKPLHPSKRALSVIWCFTLLKTEQGWKGGGWRWGWEGEKRQKSHSPAIIILSWFFSPSHSLIPLMKSGQAEACSCRQQFHCTIWASHIGWQGGEGSVGSTARRKERGRKYTAWNSEWATRDTPWCFVCSILSRSFSIVLSLHSPLLKTHQMKHATKDTCPSPDLNTYAGKQMSQVLTQNGGELCAAWPLPKLRMWCRHPDHVIREDGK